MMLSVAYIHSATLSSDFAGRCTNVPQSCRRIPLRVHLARRRRGSSPAFDGAQQRTTWACSANEAPAAPRAQLKSQSVSVALLAVGTVLLAVCNRVAHRIQLTGVMKVRKYEREKGAL